MSGHANEPWAQGTTLMTEQTRRWTPEQIASNDATERRMVFSGFTPEDQGRGRLRIAICDREEYARRIVACVNACAGISTEGLERWLNPPEGSKGVAHGTWSKQLKTLWDEAAEMERQRDGLAAAAKALADAVEEDRVTYRQIDDAREAIAKAEAQA